MSITTIVQVSGMTCTSCTNSIKKELEKNANVSSVSVSLLTEEATVTHNSNISTDQILETIDDLGFDGELISSVKNDNNEKNESDEIPDIMTILQIGGMTCSSCSNSIVNTVSKNPNIISIDVSLITEEATIVHNSNISTHELIEIIEDMGFDASLISSKSNSTSKSEKATSPHKLFKTQLTIHGMTCTSCVNSITNQFKQLKEVESINVSLMTETATIIHNVNLSIDKIKEIIDDLGFDSNIINVTELQPTSFKSTDILSANLKIFGLTNLESADQLELKLLDLQGIVNCEINYSLSTLNIEYDSNLTGIRSIINEISKNNCDVILVNKLDSTSQIDLLSKIKEINYWKYIFIRLLIFGLPVFFLGHIFPFIKKCAHMNNNKLRLFNGIYLDALLQLILGTYIQFWLGKQYYINCYKSLSHKAGSMDVLICISTTIVYFYSLFSILRSIVLDTYPNVLFDTATMLFVFVSLGKWVESKAKGSTSTALSKLLSLTPSNCLIVENPEMLNDGEDLSKLDSSLINQITISIDLLQKNDIVIILPGSTVPTDGECIFGTSEINESLLTGESSPVFKTVGSQLIGGSLNISSTIYMKVTKLGDQTQLQQIVKLVKEAQISNAPVQRYADSIASIFVPFVLLISLITLVFWLLYVKFMPITSVPKMFLDSNDEIEYFKILQVAISVIVVACPCALGLAAPTAVMVGTGVGASNGVLIKGGEVLENASNIDTVIFDKTGTLTNGVMGLTNYEFIGDYKDEEFLIWSLVNLIESNSEHPIAKALVNESLNHLSNKNSLPFQISQIQTHIGLGIETDCLNLENNNNLSVKLGNVKFMKTFKMVNVEDFNNVVNRNLANAKISSICHILINDTYVGYTELSDTLKSDARETIESFINCGYSVGMVTGDSIETSTHVAKLLGIPLNNVLAESSPEGKLGYIKKLQAIGLKVAFIGDGINDAPALVQSNTGIAISSGTDIAMSAADIVLLSSSTDSNIESSNGLFEVFESFDISKVTFHTIKLNFLLAIIYNLIMLPISMGILIIPFNVTMHPMFASAAMACSSTSVIVNSLRLKKWDVNNLKEKIQYNNNYEANNNDMNFGMDNEIMDNRLNIAELSISSFIINKHPISNFRKPFLIRTYEKITSLFRSRRSENNYYTALRNEV